MENLPEGVKLLEFDRSRPPDDERHKLASELAELGGSDKLIQATLGETSESFATRTGLPLVKVV